MEETRRGGDECGTLPASVCENMAVQSESTEQDGTSNSNSTSSEESESGHYSIPHLLSTTLSSAIQIYQPSLGNCVTSIEILPQAIPQLASNPAVFSCEPTRFAPQIPQFVANQGLFSCDRNSLVANAFSADNIAASASNTTFLPGFQNPVQSRRKYQTSNCHENSRCANCRTTNTSLWRRNEQGEVECNACNLYYRKNKRPRPLSLCKDTLTKRNRKSTIGRGMDNATS